MRKLDKKKNIPIPIIVLGYMFSPPAGIVLTLLRILTEGRAEKENTEKGSTKYDRETKTNTNDAVGSSTKRGRISVPALVLGLLAAVLFLGAGINLVEGVFTLSLVSFVQEYLAPTLILLLMSVGCLIPSLYFKKQHDNRSVIRSIIGKRETILLSQLASAADLKPKKLRKELQAMINKGEFGEEAYIDLSSGRFMRHPDETEEMLRQEQTQEASAPEEDVEESARFRAIILQIRKLNDDIKDYAVSERIYRIEEHTQNIFDYVTAHPESMPQIRSFMNYYLPTTLKLLDSYSRIEQMGVAGENMKKSKENIEQILDALVIGFEQQVDKLFANESVDISSEITVLEAMMKQDGLDGKSDFAPEMPNIEAEPAPAMQNAAQELGYTPGFTDDLTDNGTAAQSMPE